MKYFIFKKELLLLLVFGIVVCSINKYTNNHELLFMRPDYIPIYPQSSGAKASERFVGKIINLAGYSEDQLNDTFNSTDLTLQVDERNWSNRITKSKFNKRIN